MRFRLQESQKRAREIVEIIKRSRKRYYYIAVKTANIKIGDKVLLDDEVRHTFEPWYKGPYGVIKDENANCKIFDKEVNNTVNKNRVIIYKE